ncbi:MAG: ATP-binding protein [Clostridia bacterium]|jgi:DNA replication protein DnaC|nr:ATP-binding protein [Clostridia bacterium]
MKFSEIIYQKAELELKKRRLQAEKLCEARRKDFVAKHPELLDIEAEMKNTALSVIKCIGAGSQKMDINLVAKRNLEAQEAKKQLIVAAGYPEDYLDTPYSCKLCNDSGILNGKLCQCHIQLLQQLSVGELSCSPMLAKSSFEAFDVNLYTDIKDRALGFSPREYMRGCYEMLKAYAENFTPQSNSFFFCGGTGLGKTHLALAVLNRLTSRGFSVYYNTAGKIVKQLKNESFSKADSSLEEEINSSDLVIIDDLGAEFASEFGSAALNELISDAILNAKAMIIISNLSVSELESRYGQRLTSRLNGFEVLEFIGEDIRQKLK